MNKIRFIAAFIAFMAIAAKASITLPFMQAEWFCSRSRYSN